MRAGMGAMCKGRQDAFHVLSRRLAQAADIASEVLGRNSKNAMQEQVFMNPLPEELSLQKPSKTF